MMPLSNDTKPMQNNLAGVMIKKTSYTSETRQLIIWYSAKKKFKNNNNNNVYWLQMGRHPVAVVI